MEPESSNGGSRIITSGSLDEVVKGSDTGRYLKIVLQQGENSIMNFFENIKSNAENHKRNLIVLGLLEAEAEAQSNSEMNLMEVYEDFFDLANKLGTQKYIITGRKGSGKSAFAEFAYLHSKNNANSFIKFIRRGEFNLEEIIQIGKNSGKPIEREALLEWLILTNLLSLIFSKENEPSKEYRELEQFLKKNSGYINLSENQITSLVEERGFEINIEYFKRFFTGKLGNKLQINQQKAPFYKLLPALKTALISILKKNSEQSNKNSYILFFDDLDLIFNARKSNSSQHIMTLINKVKQLNAEFDREQIGVKVILLLRDDIQKSIINNFHEKDSTIPADSAKVFNSYSVNINWYQNDANDTNLNIRKFINKRISHAFEKAMLTYNESDPWVSLVEEPFKETDTTNNNNTSFKYILNHTFFRPRDLILFFTPLGNKEYSYPLNKYDINGLIGLYSRSVIDEIKNELSNFYTKEEIISIFNAFSKIAGEISASAEAKNQKNISYQTAHDIFCEFIQKDPKIVLEDMFQRSLIGAFSIERNHTYFKHLEPANEQYLLNNQHNIIIHKAVEIYCQNKGY